ncbi:uncharacterized protein LOC127871281 isoform X2 [Dreissena polymorpha]|uniref:uncharacterized protein LOC127871281 isoform X2 n=1 Tax=Dreissena polymorpha TaxID=45954 RepID=UPI002264D298|nr:uncharacterized protein LOC127871281 isoform X2 [Dreissena polymorpha]
MSEASSTNQQSSSSDKCRSSSQENANSCSGLASEAEEHGQSQSMGRDKNALVKSTDPNWNSWPNARNHHNACDYIESTSSSYDHSFAQGGHYNEHQEYSNRGRHPQSSERESQQRPPYRGGNQGNSDRGGYQGNSDRGSYQGNSDRGGYQGNSGRGGYQGNSGQQWNANGATQGRNSSWGGPGGQPYRQNSSGGYREDDSDVFLSKTLSSILRHNADRFKLNLLKGGFIYVDEILDKVHKLKGYTHTDFIRIVESNDKKRFALQEDREGKLMIRANQGHTMQVDDLDLKPLLSPDNVPCAIHGTYYESWEAIKRTGLSRMQRNHIHMAMGEPGREGVISGMRSSCEVTIRVDLKKAMDDGIKFFVSANNVILSPGNEDGLIPPKYFELVMDRKKGAKIAVDLPIAKQADNQTEKKKKKKKRSKKGKEEKSDDEQTPDTWEEKAKNEMPSSSPQETADSVTNRKRAAPPDQPVATSPPQKGHLESEPKQVTKTSQETVPDVPITTKVQASPAKLADQPWREPVTIDDVEVSKCSMDDVISKSGDHNDITVMCCGEKFGSRESKLRLLALFSRPNIYIYHLNDENHELLQEGDVLKVLRSKSVTKVLHNVKETSHGLLREYDVLLDGSPIWDIALMFEKVTLTKVELELLKEEFEFTPRSFKSWAVENEDWASKLTPEVVEKVVRRGKLIDKLYSLCMSHIHTPEVTKKIKSAVYAAANPSEAEDKELYEKYKELTKERQAKEKAEKNASKPEAPKQQQSQPNKKSGKGNKKKK